MRIVAVTVGAIAGLLLPPSPLAGQGVPAVDRELGRRIDAWMTPVRNDLSGTLLVARGGRVVVEESFGFASHELGVPFTPLTPTAVASITKPLTIIITSRLADAGKLSTADTVSRWLPEFVHGGRITIAQLLNHRAGIPHRLITDEDQDRTRTADDMVRAANDHALLFEPGARAEYSSGGYALLAAILERAGGASYDSLLQAHVARPAGARLIRHADRREILRGRATSAIAGGGTMLNTPLRDLSFLVGGGSVYTTPRDIFLVIQGLVKGTYGETARTALVRPNGIRWNGITNGYRAFADWHASDSLTVLFFGNVHVGAIDLMRREIPRIARGEAVPPPEHPRITPVTLGEAARTRLAGAYETGGGNTNRMIFVSPALALFGDRAMVPIDDSTFFSPSDYAPVTFTSNASGGVEAIQWGAGTWGTGEMGPRFPRARDR